MFYLNGTQVNEPDGWQAVYWTRVRNPEYFGIWRQRTAKIEGVGEVGFDGEARLMLLALWKRDKMNASALFEVKEGDEVLYSAEVDFAIYSDNGRHFNVGFRDEDMTLDSLSSLTVSIEPKTLIEFPEQPISDGITYQVGDGLSGTMRINGAQHAIPFATQKSGEGSGLSVVSPTSLEPIYRNSSDRKSILNLQGKVRCKWDGSGNVSIVAQVVQNGVVKDERTISILQASSTFQDAFISESIEIDQGAYMRLIVSGNSGMLVTYSTESFLIIYENSATAPALVSGLSWKQAIEGLLTSLTGSGVELSSTFLSKGLGANRVITSEMNLRGYRSGIQLSLRTLLLDMNAIDNLACWKRGNKLFIETKADMLGKVGYGRILDYEKLEHSTSGYFASSYQVGYKNWQSNTAAGRDEFCTERTYITEQQNAKATMTMSVSALSASGKTMEVLRRNPNTDKADTTQDEKLFVIEADRAGEKYIARTGNVSGVINPDNVINAGISPRSILERWSNILGINGKASFISGSGNTTAITYGKSESAPVTPGERQLFTDRYVMIETGMTIREYSELGEVIEYTDHDSIIRRALIMQDSYRFSSGKTSIAAIELQ